MSLLELVTAHGIIRSGAHTQRLPSPSPLPPPSFLLLLPVTSAPGSSVPWGLASCTKNPWMIRERHCYRSRSTLLGSSPSSPTQTHIKRMFRGELQDHEKQLASSAPQEPLDARDSICLTFEPPTIVHTETMDTRTKRATLRNRTRVHE